MAFRNIIVENPARIAVRNDQLLICTDAEHSVPLEDISALLLENRQITITTAALSRLGQCGCAVFTCDEKHMPCAVLTPYMQHSRQLSIIKSQLAMSEPRKKRLWQTITKAKIQNQARCLQLVGKEGENEVLLHMAERVRSGDGENVEATAAQLYFPALFGDGFSRGDDSGINAGLNYGYAILRGCIARYLAVYGFLPALGLHHRSTLNAFNLADDLIEPFRPVVDLLVFRYMCEDDVLTTACTSGIYYTIPRTTRELQLISDVIVVAVYYTIPRTTRELQRTVQSGWHSKYYTIPRTTRELQPASIASCASAELYHTKNYQGTTTHAQAQQSYL